MATIFFSGGIDSTVLAFDVAKNPWRYGISPKHEEFRLISAVFGEKNYKMRAPKSMRAITDLIFAEAEYNEWVSVEHLRVLCPLKNFRKSPVPHGGANSLTPLSTGYEPDILSISYTPGLHSWLALIGLNLESFARSTSHFSDPSCFFGFQYDGPIWEKYDRGEIPPNDVSPAYIDALNNLAKVSSRRPGAVFKAPFLDNRMDRTHVLEMGLSLGAPIELTSSCEKGWMKNCGYCGQCLRRIRSTSYLKKQHEEFLAKNKGDKADGKQLPEKANRGSLRRAGLDDRGGDDAQGSSSGGN